MGLNPRKTIDETIVICENCKGKGTIEHSELADYHRGEYRYWNTVCRECKGAGRLRQTVTVITETVPYDNPEVSLLLLKETDDK